ncbi:hypothetical protein ALC56_06792, partial [Trachymyrmex septentrionalis]
ARTQKAHPLGTAVLSSSSNESTVGREADMLLGERSMGLVAPPFTPVADARLSIIIEHCAINRSSHPAGRKLGYTMSCRSKNISAVSQQKHVSKTYRRLVGNFGGDIVINTRQHLMYAITCSRCYRIQCLCNGLWQMQPQRKSHSGTMLARAKFALERESLNNSRPSARRRQDLASGTYYNCSATIWTFRKASTFESKVPRSEILTGSRLIVNVRILMMFVALKASERSTLTRPRCISSRHRIDSY